LVKDVIHEIRKPGLRQAIFGWWDPEGALQTTKVRQFMYQSQVKWQNNRNTARRSAEDKQGRSKQNQGCPS